MLENIEIENILFLDIETVPEKPNFDALPLHTQNLWSKKIEFLCKENEGPKDLYKRAGIYAEFGKIICISVGYLNKATGKAEFRIKSFCSHNEKELLNQFSELLNTHFNKKESTLCAHNGKEFDFPFIARRLLINGLKIPKILSIAGKKPWEICLLDTMELWKFGDYKNYTSLNLLASVFNIPTPKDDIDGSQVWKVYWEEENLSRIITYCQKDVLTVAQLLLRFKGKELFKDENIVML